jgi:hypothetical protein
MAIGFWDKKGVLMVEFMQQGTIIMSEVYCETLTKLREILTSSVVFLYDNHVCIRALLEHFNWELFDHPPYSPNLTASKYDLFTYLNNWLQSQCFKNNELMEGVKMWLSSQEADFFDKGIQKRIPNNKCLNPGDD